MDIEAREEEEEDIGFEQAMPAADADDEDD